MLADALAAYFPDDAYADQRAAAATAARHWTSVVTGGPGTGKTTTVARLLGVLLRAHAASDDAGRPLRIALAAPTGKAAARMVQAVRESTAQRGFPRTDDGDRAAVAHDHRRCRPPRCTGCSGGRPNSTRFRHHRGNRLPYDVVVVDETSMVSLTMMARLVEAVRPVGPAGAGRATPTSWRRWTPGRCSRTWSTATGGRAGREPGGPAQPHAPLRRADRRAGRWRSATVTSTR